MMSGASISLRLQQPSRKTDQPENILERRPRESLAGDDDEVVEVGDVLVVSSSAAARRRP